MNGHATKHKIRMRQRTGNLGGFGSLSLAGHYQSDVLHCLRVHSMIFDRVGELPRIFIVIQFRAFLGDNSKKFVARKWIIDCVGQLGREIDVSLRQIARNDGPHSFRMPVAALYTFRQERRTRKQVAFRLFKRDKMITHKFSATENTESTETRSFASVISVSSVAY